MYQHSCQTAGAAGCGYTVKAGSIYNSLRDTASK